MIDFTIFKNTDTGKFAAVFDFQLPTQTGIGNYECWKPVYHGKANNFLDKVRQCKEFEKQQNSC